MKPAPFEYHRPESLNEALGLLAQHQGAKPLAGGQSLIPAMNFRLAKPAVLVDLNRIKDLSYIKEADGQTGGRADGQADGRAGGQADELLIGAMTRQATVERSDLVRSYAPLISETMPFVAHPQIRSRGTFGGSLAHADPASELPSVMVALGARFRVRSTKAERWIPAGEFYTGLFQTALQPGELLAEIAIPRTQPGTGYAFTEVSRRHGDFALVGVAVVVTMTEAGACRDARIALLSVGEGPVMAVEAAKMLAGQKATPELIREAANVAAEKDIDPPGDIHGSAAYRRQLAAVLTRRALTKAFERAVPG